MSREIVDHAYIEINSVTQGDIEVTTLSEVEVRRVDPKTAVKTMNKLRRAIGYTRGVPIWELSFTQVMEQGEEEEVDWDALNDTFEKFESRLEKEGGKRRSFRKCIVNETSERYTVDGEARRDVTLIALDEKPA